MLACFESDSHLRYRSRCMQRSATGTAWLGVSELFCHRYPLGQLGIRIEHRYER